MTLKTDIHGADLPRIGISTQGLKGISCRSEVENALKVGFRYVETAQIYHNETDVGAAIKASAVPREDLFVSTKVWIDDVRPYDLLWSVRESLDRLRLNYVDLLVLHWPNQKYSLRRTMEAMNEARERGLTRKLGVANFTAKLFQQAKAFSDAPLISNEIEYHPLINQHMVIKATCDAGASVIAYAPTADGEALNHYEISQIAMRHKRTKSQIVMRWLYQQEGVIPLPRRTRRTSFEECLEIFDFELSDSEMQKINRLRSENRRVVNPDFAPAWDEVLSD